MRFTKQWNLYIPLALANLLAAVLPAAAELVVEQVELVVEQAVAEPAVVLIG